MTAAQVAQALQLSVAGFFSNGAMNVYSIRGGDTLSLTGLVVYDSIDFLTGLAVPSLFELDAGPFGATTNFYGDLFGAFDTGTNFNGTTNTGNPGVLGAQNNDFGVSTWMTLSSVRLDAVKWYSTQLVVIRILLLILSCRFLYLLGPIKKKLKLDPISSRFGVAMTTEFH